jgi:type I restriction enzyme S subunit
MTDLLRPYTEYKDSGVPWLGEVPAHWEVKRLKCVATLNPSKSEANIALANDVPVTFLPMSRVAVDGRVDARDTRPASALWNGFTYFRRGDVLVAKITPCFENGKGACLDTLPTDIGFGSTEFIVARACDAVLPRFLYRVTTLPSFRCLGADTMVGAAGQQRVSPSFVGEFRVALPPLPEQAAIVRFLDHADWRIRRYIRAKEKLIALLEEQKRVIIYRAVTGQIDVRTGRPYPTYKPSGVEWLGEVPEHWDVRRLRNLAELRVSNVDKHTKEGEEPVRLCNYVDVYKNDCIRPSMSFMRATATKDEIARFRLSEGDVLLTKDSEAWDDIGVPALILQSADDLISGYHLALLRPSEHRISGAYLFRALQSTGAQYQFHVEAHGVTRYGLSHAAIKSVWLPAPPLAEQAAIARFLDERTGSLTEAIQRARREIALLREFRTRLIADVVTGKLDVREAAARLPDEVKEPEPLDELRDDTGAVEVTADEPDELLEEFEA